MWSVWDDTGLAIKGEIGDNIIAGCSEVFFQIDLTNT
jgi:hypothetical protein